MTERSSRTLLYIPLLQFVDPFLKVISENSDFQKNHPNIDAYMQPSFTEIAVGNRNIAESECNSYVILSNEAI